VSLEEQLSASWHLWQIKWFFAAPVDNSYLLFMLSLLDSSHIKIFVADVIAAMSAQK
jgi:hypothetical protein